MTEGFKSKEIILQAQKKFLGKVTNKNVIKLFIHERNANILDNLYRLAKIYTGNKKESEKLTKNIIKIIVKLSILYRNDQFDSNELELANNFKDKFRELTMITIVTKLILELYDKIYKSKNRFYYVLFRMFPKLLSIQCDPLHVCSCTKFRCFDEDLRHASWSLETWKLRNGHPRRKDC
eukprot:XP_016661721.1 PREDICTED: tumor necrosis factor alpha-induced protein 8-like protein isoform X2 [Acyrthosiphon pisum]